MFRISVDIYDRDICTQKLSLYFDDAEVSDNQSESLKNKI